MRRHFDRSLLVSHRCALFVLCILVLSNPARAQKSALLDDNVVEGWHKYERFSRALQGELRYSGQSSSGKGEKVTWTLKQNSECALIRDLRGGNDYYGIEIYNPSYSATLRMPLADSAKVVLTDTKLPAVFPKLLSTQPHFSYWGVPLYELVSSPSFRITKSGLESRNGRELARIEYSSVLKDKRTEARRNGVMYLDPSRYWCLVEMTENEEYFRGGKLYASGASDNRYETTLHSSGFPLLTSWTKTSKGILHTDNRKIAATIRNEYDWKVDASVPNHEFTLSAFGLPEPMGAPPLPNPTRWYLWIILAAVVCAVLAFACRRGAAHYRQKAVAKA